MTTGRPLGGDPHLEMEADNMVILQELLGADYDAGEMHGLLAGVSPEEAKKEIGLLAEKLAKAGEARAEVVHDFKAHLKYVYAS